MRMHRLWRLFATALLLSRTVSAATLSGRVTDPDGRPVAGARIVVVGALGAVADRESNSDGRFEIDALPAGAYGIHVVKDGFTADPIRTEVSASETRAIDFALRVSAIAESIVVSASQIELPLSRTTDAMTAITAADLETRQIETVADALRLVPDLAVTRSGGRGAITSLFPRGGASNYTLVLVDGMRANAFGGGYDFGHLPAADIERIEVVRGPESALYGSDAVGAVVQVVTKRGGPPHGDALIEGGNQATERFAASAAGSRNAWSWGGSVEQRRTDGFTGVAPATGELVTNDDDHLQYASGSVAWRRTNGPDVLVSGNARHDERGFPGPFGTNPVGNFTKVDRVSRGINDSRQLGARLNHPWSPRVRQRIDVNVFDLSSQFTSAFGPSTSGTRRVDGRVQEDVAFNRAFGASGGVELMSERASSTFITGADGTPTPIRRTDAGTFGEVRYVASERLFVTGGVRLEHLSRDEQRTNSINPKAAISYVAKSTRLHASAGTGIRPPDAFEIAFTDNPNLKPERSRSIGGGVEQHLTGDALVVGAAAFYNRYDDLLITVGRSLRDASRYKTDNISNALARGVELTVDARPSQRLSVRGTYAFVHTEILSVDGLAATAPPPFKVGDPLLRRPKHQGAVDVVYAHGRLSAFADLTTRGRTLDVEPSFGASGGLFICPGYAVGNVGARIRLARRFDAYARVLNVTDRVYEEALGFPALGRSALVGVRVAGGR
jgi:outer membrane cobalamin receptor